MDSILLIILYVVLLLPFVVLSLVLFLQSSGRKKKDKKALQALIDQTKSDESEHRKAIAEFLTSKAGMKEGDALNEAVDNVYSARKGVLQKLITAFLTRDRKHIENINAELNPLVDTYQTMELAVISESLKSEGDTPPEKDTSHLEATIEKLKKENKNLKVEVHTTLATLNAIFTEYASIFGDVKDKKDMTVDEILSAMESFGEGDVESAGAGDVPADELLENVDDEQEEELSAHEEEPSIGEEEPSAEEGEPSAEEGEPSAGEEPEPSWDEALEEQAASTEEIDEPSAEEGEPSAGEEPEPSWDEALEEQAASAEEPSAEEELEAKEADEWGDEGSDEDLEHLDDMEEIQPEWGNAMEEDIDPDDEDKK